jgi:hypothetical protein
MKSLYKLGTSIKFQGVTLDCIKIEDHKESEYRANGWGSPWDILEESKSPTFKEVDTNKSGALSVDEVREAAKEAGVEGWDTKRIKTLKKELGLSNGNESKAD